MIYTKKLLEEYHESPAIGPAKTLTFVGVDGLDVYNITAPFKLGDAIVIAGRVEARDSEVSTIRLFSEKESNHWYVIENSLELNLQDPFYMVVDEKVILGGVEVFFDEQKTNWRTVFYCVEGINDATRIFEGPLGMKDLRLKQLADNRILVLTRPQGTKGGRGKIGYCIIDRLDDLTIPAIENAPLLKNQFIDDEWGGGNEIHLLEEQVFVLGHIANFDENGDRHYYAMSFELDLLKGEMLVPKIIAERMDFREGPSKRPDLTDVVLSGGLVLSENTATLYAGISDAGAQKIIIKNPFK
ncbi:DUF1861 family protein [Enterococcus olivae]